MAKEPTAISRATRGELEAIAKLAGRIAVTVPLRPTGTGSGTAYVPWGELIELRNALQAIGFDWRAGCKRYQELLSERRKATGRRSHG